MCLYREVQVKSLNSIQAPIPTSKGPDVNKLEVSMSAADIGDHMNVKLGIILYICNNIT